MRTKSAKKQEIKAQWYVADVEGKVLGRAATRIASILRGKHRPYYTPHVDTGDFVVVTNAAKVRVTGNKDKGKTYFRHSNWPGGVIAESVEKLRIRKPEEIIRLAVVGMLPDGPLGYAMIKKLKIYGGGDHPHAAQNPQPLTLL